MITLADSSGHTVRATRASADITAAQRLRFEVFNLELGEGLADSIRTGLDSDEFDAQCDHLIIENGITGEVVGTYRLQTGEMAAAGRGYYSATEFDFSPFEPFRGSILELGRACIHKDHRKRSVLDLLWRGIGTYAMERGSRYLLGCSSLNSQAPADGWGLYHRLKDRHLAPMRSALHRPPDTCFPPPRRSRKKHPRQNFSPPISALAR